MNVIDVINIKKKKSQNLTLQKLAPKPKKMMKWEYSFRSDSAVSSSSHPGRAMSSLLLIHDFPALSWLHFQFSHIANALMQVEKKGKNRAEISYSLP